MKIYIIHHFNFEINDISIDLTIWKIKKIIEEKCGFEAERQRIISAGFEFKENSKSLKGYNFNGTTLFIVLRPLEILHS